MTLHSDFRTSANRKVANFKVHDGQNKLYYPNWKDEE